MGLDMTVAECEAIGEKQRAAVFDPPHPLLRRIVFFSAVIASVVLAASALFEIFIANGFEVIEGFILGLFVLNFIPIALSFWTSVAGFVLRLLKRDPINLRPIADLNAAASTPISNKTAIAIPVYNEDPHRVFAGIEAIYTSLQAVGGLDLFDFFILSDTTNDAIVLNESRYLHDFHERLDASKRVHYRRRPRNTGRKAGNIADFCERWGHAYECMVVLDADSVMSGTTLLRMVRLMEANPRAGLIQSQPMPFNQNTLFGRALQFGSRMVGPVLSSGLSFWHLGESNYWGHNTIIRTQAFIDNCGLPELPGKPPLGGQILSHDYVEAALLRRGGWHVYFVPELDGSHEELPGNIIDYAKRDRRWCQGNLQHLKILGTKGFHSLSRVHLLQGAFAYLSSPIWALFLMLSTADVIEQAITGHRYFTGSHQLYPNWPISMLTETVSLFVVTMGMLLTPKIFALVVVLLDRRQRRLYGGGMRASSSLAVETLFSMLIAPVMGGLHAYFVLSLLLGRGVGWNPQNRSDRGLTVRETVSSLGLFFAMGIGWLIALMTHAPNYVWWVLPILTGLILAIPLSIISSRRSVGEWLRNRGVLLTPEETDPPAELRTLYSTSSAFRRMPRQPIRTTPRGAKCRDASATARHQNIEAGVGSGLAASRECQKVINRTVRARPAFPRRRCAGRRRMKIQRGPAPPDPCRAYRSGRTKNGTGPIAGAAPD